VRVAQMGMGVVTVAAQRGNSIEEQHCTDLQQPSEAGCRGRPVV
jgi:hypothetical protein